MDFEGISLSGLIEAMLKKKSEIADLI